MTPISSLQNPHIKQLRALRQRKERERSGLFFAEGLQLVAAALTNSAAIEEVVIAPGLLGRATVGARHTRFRRELELRLRAGCPHVEVSDTVFRSLSERDEPQGIGVVMRQRWVSLERLPPAERRCRVALDGIQYPGNLGTILRTCDATGCAGVILLGATADPYDPAAVRASAGAVLTQGLTRGSPAGLGSWARERGAMVVGTSPYATRDYRSVRYDAPTILAMGSEGHGLSPELQRLCDTLVRIPMIGSADSLNLAIATGLVLYEVFRQRESGAMAS